MEINLYPSKCNICSGKVIFISNSKIYNGKEYGSGYCYFCENCKSYVGTHKNEKNKALGILADDKMRKMKVKCHNIFDSFWLNDKNKKLKRTNMYKWLARELEIPVDNCHFGYFDFDILNKAYNILLNKTLKK